MSKGRCQKLFKRYEGNPILTPDMWPYPVSAVFNPGAIEDFNGQTLLLVRAEDYEGYSHFTCARSNDGKTNWQIDSEPTFEAKAEFKEKKFGVEDSRIVWVEKLQRFVITYVSFDTDFDGVPTLSLMETKDFREFKRLGRPVIPENKDGALFSKIIQGNYVLVNRPVIKGRRYIAVCFSSDLKSWYGHRIIIGPRGGSWDEAGVGLGPPPIWTPQGWLIIYHGTREKASKLIYRVGLALLDLEKIEMTHQSKGRVFGPEKGFEGGKDGIVFPCGAIVKGNELRMYYGADDDVVALATANLEEILDYLIKCPAS